MKQPCLAVICLFLLCTLVTVDIVASETAVAAPETRPIDHRQTAPGEPANPSASDDAHKLLKFLYNLNRDQWSGGAIVGQQIGNPEQAVGDESEVRSYTHVIEGLHRATGKWPALVGQEYEYDRSFTLDEIKAANKNLKDHWSKGGLVTVGFAPTNPWGKAQDWSDINTTKPDKAVDLNQLLPGGSKRAEWLAKLDIIAAGLADLRDAGVVVLFRPMMEMNQIVFWWGKNTDAKPPRNFPHHAYKAVFRDMFDYFTHNKGLNNLLWVFSPGVSNQWSSYPYPGDAYVDIVAGTYYSDGGVDQYGLSASPGYDDFLSYRNKAIGQGEWGKGDWSDDRQGKFDNRALVNEVSNNFPRLSYFMVWTNWKGMKMAIVDNQHASELMNDSRAICRGDPRLNWRDN